MKYIYIIVIAWLWMLTCAMFTLHSTKGTPVLPSEPEYKFFKAVGRI